MIYVSLDIETTGTDPRVNGILSIGAYAYNADIHRNQVDVSPYEGDPGDDQFYLNLDIPHTRAWDLETENWWLEEAGEGALEAATRAPRFEPGTAMRMFWEWFTGSDDPENEDNQIGLICYPTQFDHAFMASYFSEFAPEYLKAWMKVPTVDLRTMAMMTFHTGIKTAGRRHWPKWMSDEEKGLILHNAFDDAKIQMHYFLRMLEELWVG